MKNIKIHHLFTAILASLILFCAVPDASAQNQITPRKQTHQTQPKKRTPAKKNKPARKQDSSDNRNPCSAKDNRDDDGRRPYGSVFSHDLYCNTEYNHMGSKAIKFSFKVDTHSVPSFVTVVWRISLYYENGSPVYHAGEKISFGNEFLAYEDIKNKELIVVIPYDIMPDTDGIQKKYIASITFTNKENGDMIYNTGLYRYNFDFWKD